MRGGRQSSSSSTSARSGTSTGSRRISSSASCDSEASNRAHPPGFAEGFYARKVRLDLIPPRDDGAERENGGAPERAGGRLPCLSLGRPALPRRLRRTDPYLEAACDARGGDRLPARRPSGWSSAAACGVITNSRSTRAPRLQRELRGDPGLLAALPRLRVRARSYATARARARGRGRPGDRLWARRPSRTARRGDRRPRDRHRAELEGRPSRGPGASDRISRAGVPPGATSRPRSRPRRLPAHARARPRCPGFLDRREGLDALAPDTGLLRGSRHRADSPRDGVLGYLLRALLLLHAGLAGAGLSGGGLRADRARAGIRRPVHPPHVAWTKRRRDAAARGVRRGAAGAADAFVAWIETPRALAGASCGGGDRGEVVRRLGGGSKAVGFLAALEVSDEVACVVDVNPAKHGMFMPGTGHEIVPPERLVELQPDLVVVMNPAYADEIRADLARSGSAPSLTSSSRSIRAGYRKAAATYGP